MTRRTHHKTMKQYTKPSNRKHSLAWALWRRSHRLPRRTKSKRTFI